MENSRSAAYAAAGVDITAGYEGVRLMRDDVKRTRIPVSYTHLTLPTNSLV